MNFWKMIHELGALQNQQGETSQRRKPAWRFFPSGLSTGRGNFPFHEEMNPGLFHFPKLSFLPGVASRQFPKINFGEENDQILIEALAPGVDPQTLKVNLERNILSISGEKTAPVAKKEAFHRSERSAGRFIRTIEIPVEVDPNKVSADYKNGMLLIRIGKAEKTKPKKIDVKTS